MNTKGKSHPARTDTQVRPAGREHTDEEAEVAAFRKSLERQDRIARKLEKTAEYIKAGLGVAVSVGAALLAVRGAKNEVGRAHARLPFGLSRNAPESAKRYVANERQRAKKK